MKLSPTERLSLMNQFRILGHLEETEQYDNYVDILQSGYEGLYQHIFEHVYDPQPAEISDEVFEILDMYRALDNAYRKGVAVPSEGRPKFDGFDGNNDPHFGVAQFILDKLGLYAENNGRPRNSHSRAELPIYRQMLARWRGLGKPYDLNEAQVSDLVGAGLRRA